MIAALLVMTMLLIMGMAFLSQKSAQYEAVVKSGLANQARAIAQAGLVDFKLKVAKSRSFPPPRPKGQTLYSYTEDFSDIDGRPHGFYTITCDSKLDRTPYWLLQVTSEGVLGSRAEPRARFRIYGELDLSSTLRNAPSQPNPTYRQWILFRDGDLPDQSLIPNY